MSIRLRHLGLAGGRVNAVCVPLVWLHIHSVGVRHHSLMLLAELPLVLSLVHKVAWVGIILHPVSCGLCKLLSVLNALVHELLLHLLIVLELLELLKLEELLVLLGRDKGVRLLCLI